MDIEIILLDELRRYAPSPTFRHAVNCFEVYRVQNAAIKVAALKREEGIELNTRRREIEHMPPLNYRDFLVGAVAVGIVPIRGRIDRYEWYVSSAYNTKPHPNEPKFCAERRNGRRLVRRGCTCCAGVAIVAELNATGDGRSGLHAPGPSLDICEGCRDDAQTEFYDLYCEDTLVITENSVTHKRSEPRKLPQVFAHHGEVWWASDRRVVPFSKYARR